MLNHKKCSPPRETVSVEVTEENSNFWWDSDFSKILPNGSVQAVGLKKKTSKFHIASQRVVITPGLLLQESCAFAKLCFAKTECSFFSVGECRLRLGWHTS